jgi:hypothetical protein
MQVHILGYKCILLSNIGAKFQTTSAMPCISPAKACALPSERMAQASYYEEWSTRSELPVSLCHLMGRSHAHQLLSEDIQVIEP